MEREVAPAVTGCEGGTGRLRSPPGTCPRAPIVCETLWGRVRRGDAGVILTAAVLAAGALAALVVLAAPPEPAAAQPLEVRVRSLHVPPEGGTVAALDRLGTRGVVIRDSEPPGRFWTRLPGAVGDVDGDGFSDLGIFWGTVGDVIYEVLYVVHGRADLPQVLDGSTIREFSTRFTHNRTDVESGLRNNFGAVPRVLPAGDVDRDGFDDFFVGMNSFGIVYLVYGGEGIAGDIDLVAPPEGIRTTSFSPGGYDASAGGDLDGDGIADFAFAAPFASQDPEVQPPGLPGPGRAYVLRGREEGYTGLVDLKEAGSSLPGTILEGNEYGQGFGMEVTFAGDVNGDGLDDLLIGATRWTGRLGAVGDHVLLLYGAPDLPARLTDNEVVAGGWGVRLLREDDGAAERNTVAPLGDVNQDGFADILIGAPGDEQRLGAAYVVFGRDLFEEPEVDLLRLMGSGGATRFYGGGYPDLSVTPIGVGVSLAAADYDRDGILDLLLGSANVASRLSKQAGQVHVVRGPFGPPGGNWSLDDLRTGELAGALVTTEIPEWLGQAVRNLGDMNGDGYEDIVASAPYIGTLPNHIEPGLCMWTTWESGAVCVPHPSLYVVFGTGGQPGPLRLDEACPAAGPLAGGSEVTLVGQGFAAGVEVEIGGREAAVLRVETSARLVVELPAAEAPGPATVSVRRGEDRVEAAGLFRYVEPFYPDIDLQDLATSGEGIIIEADAASGGVLDHDGDGFGDVVFKSADGVVIVYGRGQAPEGSVITVVPWEEELPEGTARLRLSDQDRWWPFAPGDLDADGIDDVAVVSRDIVTVVFGGRRFAGSLETAALLETGEAAAILVSGARTLQGAAGNGDFDGDGIGDLVLYRRGVVHVVRGRRPWPPLRGLAGEPEFRVSGEQNRTSGALVGDVDGDGSSELLIGAPGLHWGDRGNGFLVFGGKAFGSERAEELAASGAAFQINSAKEKDSLGFEVAGVGDFDGDRVPDLAISAQAGSLEFAGESYVVFGGQELRGAAPLELGELGDGGVRIRGEFRYDEAADLAPAGDFNGDGRADLLISGGNLTASNNSNPFPSRSYLLLGGARGMLNLGKLGDAGFRIQGGGERAESIGGTDFNGDGFDDVVVLSDSFLYVVFGWGTGELFLRGDCDGDGELRGTVNDAIANFQHCFRGREVPCLAACDADADGNPCTGVTDGLRILLYVFRGRPLPPPFPECRLAPVEPGLGCEETGCR